MCWKGHATRIKIAFISCFPKVNGHAFKLFTYEGKASRMASSIILVFNMIILLIHWRTILAGLVKYHHISSLSFLLPKILKALLFSHMLHYSVLSHFLFASVGFGKWVKSYREEPCYCYYIRGRKPA